MKLTLSLPRLALCCFAPPLGVYDKGIVSVLIVLGLTIVGWIPGMCCAIAMCMFDNYLKGGGKDEK